MQLLCDQGVVLDVIDFDGNTALLHAAKNKHLEVLSFLIAKGARTDTINKEGNTMNTFKCRGEYTHLLDIYMPMLIENDQKRAILMSAAKKVYLNYK